MEGICYFNWWFEKNTFSLKCGFRLLHEAFVSAQYGWGVSLGPNGVGRSGSWPSYVALEKSFSFSVAFPSP